MFHYICTNFQIPLPSLCNSFSSASLRFSRFFSVKLYFIFCTIYNSLFSLHECSTITYIQTFKYLFCNSFSSASLRCNRFSSVKYFIFCTIFIILFFARYRQLLVRTLHTISMKFPEVAASVIPILMDFLSDNNEFAATDVLVFVREAIQRFEVSCVKFFFFKVLIFFF